MSTVESWRGTCDPKVLPAIDALRAIVLAANHAVVETIKWNAPSFSLDGQDRITLGVERKGGVRAVLHRGTVKPTEPFSFDDQGGLARWPSSDRGIVTFPDAAAVEAKRDEMIELFARWLDAGS